MDRFIPHIWPLIQRRPGIWVPLVSALLAGWSVPVLASSIGADAPAAIDASIDASFDRSQLAGGGHNIGDISRFERGNPVLPGNYRTDIYLNNGWIGRGDVRFASPTPDASAVLCITKAMFQQLGLTSIKLTPERQALLADEQSCVSMGQLITDATAAFDQSNLRLDLSVPQASMGYHARGYVDPQYWDNGVTAALLNYNLNVYRSGGQTSAYMGLNAGFNIGPWHFRQDSNVMWQSATKGVPSRLHWQNLATYVRRDIPKLRAQLTVGDSYTSGDVFDSFRVRGVQLATDDRMLPDSLRGYAPTVRGVAETNARVTMRQGGVVIYETTVAPGPFVINDLYSTGYGGDLVVSVAEADGRLRTFNVPYASVPQLLRPGTNRFSLTVGQLHNAGNHAKPPVVQATLQRGISNLLTGYAGIAAFKGYASAQAGTAINTRFGAFSIDLSVARTQIPGYSTQTGERIRLGYSKILPGTSTSLAVAVAAYSTRGYLSLSDALFARDDARGYVRRAEIPSDGIPGTSLVPDIYLPPAPEKFTIASLDRQRGSFSLNVSQTLGKRGGSVYATATGTAYWNRNSKDVQFQVGYTNSIGRLNYGLSATRSREYGGRYVNQFFGTIMIPLGSGSRAPQFTANVNTDGHGGTATQLGLNGSAGADYQFSYGASVSHGTGDGGNSTSGTVYGDYRGTFAEINASYGKGNGYSQQSFGASGGLVIHSGGITFGQKLGDTVGLVSAPDARGARVLNGTNVKINGSGYALLPYMTAYNLNTVQIDPKGLPMSVQLDSTSAQIAPHLGAVVMVKFKTSSGRSLLVRVRQANGQSVPFGSEVLDEQGHVMGVVGQAGATLVRGVRDSGQLRILWKDGDQVPMVCPFSYQVPPGKKAGTSNMFERIEATCTAQPNIDDTQTARNGK